MDLLGQSWERDFRTTKISQFWPFQNYVLIVKIMQKMIIFRIRGFFADFFSKNFICFSLVFECKEKSFRHWQFADQKQKNANLINLMSKILILVGFSLLFSPVLTINKLYSRAHSGVCEQRAVIT